jgi:arginase
MGLAHVVSRAIEIAGTGTQGIHVSFDIDAVTPDEAPGVGTPVHSGLTVREAFLAMEMLYECQKVCSVDMVEVNPILDIQNKTGNLACELILSLLGKTVF